MKFKLTDYAPETLSRSLVAVNPTTGLRQRKVELFSKSEVYDTKDFENDYPEFTKTVLEIRQQIANANPTQVAEYRAAYGDRLHVKKCGVCGGTKAELLFPLFEEA